MNENISNFLKDYRKLNNHIDSIYDRKAESINDILEDIEDKFGHLLDDDELESDFWLSKKQTLKQPRREESPTDEWNGLWQSKTKLQLPKPRASRKKESMKKEAVSPSENLAIAAADSSRRVTRSSNSRYLSAVNETRYLDAIEENCHETDVKKETSRNDETITISEDLIKIPNAPKHEPKQNEELLEEKKFEIKITKPIPNNSTNKVVSAKIKTKTFEDAQKKKMNLGAIYEANKRKRDERVQKVAAQRELVAKEKRLVCLKNEKLKEEKRKQLKLQKEVKFKQPKSTSIKIDPKKIKQKAELISYNIDDMTEDASSDDEAAPKQPVPRWATKEMREHPSNVQAWLNKEETVYKWFFNENLKKPNLEELFSTKVKMRTRTSSAVWH